MKEAEQLQATIESAVEKDCELGEFKGRAWVNITGGKPPYTIQWIDLESITNEIHYKQGGLLKVKVIDALGCTRVVESEVAELDSFQLEIRKLAINSGTEITVDEELIFEFKFPTTPISWEWDFGDSQKSSQKAPIHAYKKPGSYKVEVSVKDSYGCSSVQEAEVLVHAQELLVIPNAFSPNGDKLNDHFIPKMKGLKEVRIQIFNIWGELIYTGNDLEGSDWDGTHNGQIATAGNYIYRLDYINQEGIKKSLTGPLTLIR